MSPFWEAENGSEVLKKLILEILEIPAGPEAVKRLFSQGHIRCAKRRNRMSPKNFEILIQIAVYNSKLKFKLSKIFLFFRKNTRIYTIIHENTRFGKNTRVHVTVFANTRKT